FAPATREHPRDAARARAAPEGGPLRRRRSRADGRICRARSPRRDGGSPGARAEVPQMRPQALVGKKNGAKGAKGPRYRQIADGLLKDIASGKLAVGNLLLPEEDLSRIFKVSRGTLRQSLALLEDQGVILRRQRAGTKVLARFPGRGVVSGEQLLEDWARYGIEYPLKITDITHRRPPAELVKGERE